MHTIWRIRAEGESPRVANKELGLLCVESSERCILSLGAWIRN
jgi:hypothetical protein